MGDAAGEHDKARQESQRARHLSAATTSLPVRATLPLNRCGWARRSWSKVADLDAVVTAGAASALNADYSPGRLLPHIQDAVNADTRCEHAQRGDRPGRRCRAENSPAHRAWRCRSGGASRRSSTPPPPSSSMTVGMARNTNIAQIAPTMPALTPRRRKCRSNSRAMKRSVAPTKCSDLDDLAVGGHGALGGGDDDGGGRGPDQQQDGEAAERERAGDGADLLLPAAVIVERDALELLVRASRAGASRSGGACAVELDGDRGAEPAGRCSASVWPSHGSSSWAASATLERAGRWQCRAVRDRKPRHVGDDLVDVGALSCASICTVTSLAMSRSQAEADWFIM